MGEAAAVGDQRDERIEAGEQPAAVLGWHGGSLRGGWRGGRSLLRRSTGQKRVAGICGRRRPLLGHDPATVATHWR
jgi:hypothetical protein